MGLSRNPYGETGARGTGGDTPTQRGALWVSVTGQAESSGSSTWGLCVLPGGALRRTVAPTPRTAQRAVATQFVPSQEGGVPARFRSGRGDTDAPGIPGLSWWPRAHLAILQ